MGAAYAGLGALTSPAQSAAVKRQVEREGRAGLKREAAGGPRPVHHRDGHGQRRQASPGRSSAPRWSTTAQAMDADAREPRARRVHPTVPGFYFFGLALAEAYHSVMIGVSTWGSRRARCGATSTAARSSAARSTTSSAGRSSSTTGSTYRRLGHVHLAGAAARRGEPARGPGGTPVNGDSLVYPRVISGAIVGDRPDRTRAAA